MGVTDRVWGALTSMIKLEDKVTRQAEALQGQQARIEDLTARVIRLEAQLELLTSAAVVRNLVKRHASTRIDDGPAILDYKGPRIPIHKMHGGLAMKNESKRARR